jgi:hypothetical protein
MSKIYSDFLAGKYQIKISDEEIKEMTGVELVNATIKNVLVQAEGPSVSMLKEIREAIEGSKVEHTGGISVSITPQDEAL